MMAEPRVLVVGAGIAGLALARALERVRIGADVVERAGQWPTGGAGLYLPANAVRALDALGLGEEVAAVANRIDRQQILDERGRVLLDVDVTEVWGDVAPCLAIMRDHLHAVLRRAAGTASVTLARGVAGVAPDGTVAFDYGPPRQYDLVAGADGVNSTVRRAVFDGPEARFLGQLAWRFIATDSAATGWTMRLGSGGRSFLTVDLGGGRTYCCADIHSSAPLPSTVDWRTHFAGFDAPVQRLLEQGADAHLTPLSEVPVEGRTDPRVVLIGDAAHASSPSLSQGVAMAVEDALVLAEQLRALPVEAALAAFRARRTPRLRYVTRQNRLRDRTRNLPAQLRNLALRRVFRGAEATLRQLP